MKTIIYSIILVFISLNTQAQNTNLTPFTGHWQWIDGNKTFTVEIYQTADSRNGVHLEGHYKMEETTNGLTATVYTSNKFFATTGGVDWYYGSAIYGNSYDDDPTYFGASIEDNVLYGDGTYTVKRGNLSFQLLDTSPVTATWKVEGIYGTHPDNEPINFTIPTDITLTKID